MKQIITILTIILFSGTGLPQQSDDAYSSLWKQIEKLEKEGLTKSALKVANQVSNKAQRENNTAQIVKSLLYVSKYMKILEEDAQLAIIRNFQTAITNSSFPVTNILESYLANLYWQYFQQNRYQFYNRSRTASKVDSTDFRTWDLRTLFNQIGFHFDKSLEEPGRLQNISVSEYESLLIKQPGSEIFRPFLYDLLAHAALQFYTNDENSISRPTESFELGDTALLSEATKFIALEIEHQDSLSLQLKALKMYQDLVGFHLREGNAAALAAIDLERLSYIHQNAVFNNKTTRYEAVLKRSALLNTNPEHAALYRYELARLYDQMAKTYQPGTVTEHRWKKKEALELCEQIISNHPKSTAALKSLVLKAEIQQRDVQLTIEQYQPSNTPSKLLVSYKNQDELELKAYSITQQQILELNDLYPLDKKRSFIRKLPLIKQWKTPLKNEKDYQTHTTEVHLPELKNGLYIILATPLGSDKAFAFGHTQITNMALLESRTESAHVFQLINRKDGEPMAGARLKLSFRAHHDSSVNTVEYTTDKMGMVTIPLTEQNRTSIQITANFKNERAYFGAYYIRRKPASQNDHDINYSAFLFTDRSIYRPGQALFFKGIAIKNDGQVSTVSNELDVWVLLKDVNGQEVARQAVTTNEFGSFHGEFVLPNTGLTGRYSLEVTADDVNLRGTTDLSVEEYKRPKFKAEFDPIAESYSVNDSIPLTGSAVAFAGSKISDAKISYRVKRIVQFPIWYYRHRTHFNYTPQEIAFGTAKTDENGKFKISFIALPDNSISKENLPVFTYEITADITDINGETRTASTLVRVGYHSLQADISIPEQLDKNLKTNKLTINTTNLNGQKVTAKGTIKIYKLTAPEYVLRRRPWPAPDYKGFTEEKFKELFPYEAYDKEDNIRNWKKGQLLWERHFDTQQRADMALGNIKKWQSGNYIIELETIDKYGQSVQGFAQTVIYGQDDKSLSDNQLFDISTDKSTYTTGDTVALTLASNMKQVYVTLYIEKNRKVIEKKVIRLGREKKTLDFPLNTNDLGGFAINYSFSAFNCFYSGSMTISVPYPSTQLELTTVTFRDKLQPGTTETWSFNIKGPKGELVAAEILAGMYDASLDAFKAHSWNFNPLQKAMYYPYGTISAHQNYGLSYFQGFNPNSIPYSHPQQAYDTFNTFGLYFGYGVYRDRLLKPSAGIAGRVEAENMRLEEADAAFAVVPVPESEGVAKNLQDGGAPIEDDNINPPSPALKIRENFKETAFFYPLLHTDKAGNISFTFNTPEALTAWNLMLLAHTKSLESSTLRLQAVTQKELMVLPNVPRFLRTGDEISLSSKIANLTDDQLRGKVIIELRDGLSGKEISSQLLRTSDTTFNKTEKSFAIAPGGNTDVNWRVKIPAGIQAIQYRIIAISGNHSDGEQHILPVLSNKTLVTETMPIWVRGNQSKKFTLEKLRKNASTTLKHHQLSLEITSNPAWYAVQALPYLMEYPYECNEQMFARYFANALASHIATTNPEIARVFEQWQNSDVLISNLEKNQELKSLLIQETPWLRDAQSETEQKKRIALLFDMNRMRDEKVNALYKLQTNQMNSGAWPWFKGGRASRHITQHIISGMGYLQRLGIKLSDKNQQKMISGAVAYLDNEFTREYEQLLKYTKNPGDDHLSTSQSHYLYMRSFFEDIPMDKKTREVHDYYMTQGKKYWANKNLYTKGLLALVMFRNNDKQTAARIVRSLRENSISNEELGMYWKENTNSWHWYQAPIATQALMIEVFSETGQDLTEVDNLKIWLLKNKQTNQWKTTKATSTAVYALLLKGSDWLAVGEDVSVQLGKHPLPKSKLENVQVEAGSGYYKTSWKAGEVTPDLAEVVIRKTGNGIAWGGLYWQYFEDLDKITGSDTPLLLKKSMFLKKNTASGELIEEIKKNTALKVGDLLRVRIVLRADRAMEFVHMKDMRASGLEPVDVLSEYKWQDGLGYYQSTKDASTNFFFDYLPKGVFVFEYDLRVNNAGDFSNGIASIQSMYAPEFSSHSEGMRLLVAH